MTYSMLVITIPAMSEIREGGYFRFFRWLSNTGLLAAVFLSPFSTTLKSAALVLALLGWLPRLGLTRGKDFTTGVYSKPLLLIVVIGTLSAFFSWRGRVSLSLLNKEIIQFALLYLLLINHRSVLKRLPMCLLISVIISIALCFQQHFYGGLKQTVGLMDHPNIFGGYLAAMFPIVVSLFFRTTYNFMKIALVILSVCILLSLVFTGCRTALVLATVGLLATFLVTRRYLAASLVGLAIILTLVLPMASLKMTRESNLSRFSWHLLTQSTCVRAKMWEGALRTIADFPLLGVGPGNFSLSFRRLKILKKYDYIRDLVLHAHNIFLHLWAELGFLGPVAMIMAIVTFYNLTKSITLLSKTSVQADSLGAAFTISLLIVLLHSFVDFLFCASSYTYLVIALLAFHEGFSGKRKIDSHLDMHLLNLLPAFSLTFFICHYLLYRALIWAPITGLPLLILLLVTAKYFIYLSESSAPHGCCSIMSALCITGFLLLMFAFIINFLATPLPLGSLLKAITIPLTMCFFMLLVQPTLLPAISPIVPHEDAGGQWRIKNKTVIIILFLLAVFPITNLAGQAVCIVLSKQAISERRFGRASTFASTALNLDSSCGETYLLRGKLYFQEGNIQQAFDCFKQAVIQNPHPESMFWIEAESCVRQDKWNSVAKLAVKRGGLEILSPNDPTISTHQLQCLYEAFLNTGHQTEAEVFATAIKTRDDH